MRSVCSMGAKDKMRYIEDNLAEGGNAIPFSATALLEEGEEIVYETRRHWAVAMPYLIAALLLGRFTYGLSLSLLLLPLFQIKTYDYTLTDRRFIAREGVRRGICKVLPLAEVVTATPALGPLGAKLGLGSVMIETDSAKYAFHKIEDPAALAFYINRAVARARTGDA